MATRVMNQTEKLTLSTNSTFQEKCKQAIRDFSTYWSTHDGSGLSTEADRIKWAKDRITSVKYVKNPLVSDDAVTVAWVFLNAAKGKTYNIVDNPEDAVDLIALWDAASSFDEFVNEFFKAKGDEIDMTLSGN